jgi:hypothetical protein
MNTLSLTPTDMDLPFARHHPSGHPIDPALCLGLYGDHEAFQPQ